MLQKYDKTRSLSLLALAAAMTTLVPVASAQVTCDPSDGYGLSLTAYVNEAAACIAGNAALQAETRDELIARMNRDREAAGVAPLVRRESLDQAASAHAIDMAARGYVGHTDKEGRDHVYRIRAFDRSMLVGATGANVLVTGEDADAGDIYVAMKEDDANASNLVHDGFTHVGAASVLSAGQVYTVLVFAAQAGELREALPLTLASTTPIRATLSDRAELVGWGLTDQASGEVLAKGKGSRVSASRLDQTLSAALDLVVTARTDTLVLKGPLVAVQ